MRSQLLTRKYQQCDGVKHTAVKIARVQPTGTIALIMFQFLFPYLSIIICFNYSIVVGLTGGSALVNYSHQ